MPFLSELVRAKTIKIECEPSLRWSTKIAISALLLSNRTLQWSLSCFHYQE